ncbi:MAG: hypothetical protein IJV11_13250, partial [Muribaculaceae bacterium]|nr:hypothetical protein [Muribaculaceae bacterium]
NMDDNNVHVSINWPESDGERVYTGQYTYARTYEAQSYEVEAYVKEGTTCKESLHATTTIEVPAKEKSDVAAPVITTNMDDNNVHVSINWPESDGERVYTGQYTYARTYEAQSYEVEAYVKEGTTCKESLHATDTINVPAIVVPVTDAPVINYDAETFTVEAIGKGVVRLYVNDILVNNPYTFEQTNEEVTYTVTATAQEEGKQISEVVTRTVVVPAKEEPTPPEPAVTPAPVITYEVFETSVEITATGEGDVSLYVDGHKVPGQVYYISRGSEDKLVVASATAQAEGCQISETATREITIPALGEGYFVVIVDGYGQEKAFTMEGDIEDYLGVQATIGYEDWTYIDQEDPNDVYNPTFGRFYLLVNGKKYGPKNDDDEPLLTVEHDDFYFKNEIFANDNLWRLMIEYKGQIIGIRHENDGKYYMMVQIKILTGIDEMNADKAVAGVRYFNMAGQEMPEADGMTIVVTTYTDGSTSAVKVIK